MEASKKYVRDLFSGSSKMIIPFFQRSYSWEEDNWGALWDSINSIYTGERKKEHFIGSIIIKIDKIYSVEKEFHVIDGQQRLLTLSIILKAFQNEIRQWQDKPLDAELNSFLKLDGNSRITTNHVDQSCYNHVINSAGHEEVDSYANRQHRIIECYKFFKDKIQYLDGIAEPSERLKLLSIIAGNSAGHNYKSLALVHVGLGDIDNEQEIFDTVNSYGVALRVSELIKNFMFNDRFWGNREDAENHYKHLWQYVFEKYAQDTIYWDKAVARGRNKTTNLDAFLYAFLIVERTLASPLKAKRVEFQNLFQEYKKIIKEHHKKGEMTNFLVRMAEYSLTYRSVFETSRGDDDMKFSDSNKRLLLTLKIMGLVLADPLILYYYHNNSDAADKKLFDKSLDSYLVRRLVCKLPRGGYDTLFIDALSFIAKDKGDFNDFAMQLKNSDNARRLPLDVEFKKMFKDNSYATNTLPRLFLYSIALKQLSGAMSYKNTLEHIMPKSWKNTPWESLDMTREERDSRYVTIRTIGNLTLVKKAVNSSMKNSRWNTKKKALKQFCWLPLTTDFLDKDDWTEQDIRARSRELSVIAAKVWPEPTK